MLLSLPLSRREQKLNGPTGLFFTDTSPKETLEWFESFQKPDFARAGNVASRDVTLPVGECCLISITLVSSA